MFYIDLRYSKMKWNFKIFNFFITILNFDRIWQIFQLSLGFVKNSNDRCCNIILLHLVIKLNDTMANTLGVLKVNRGFSKLIAAYCHIDT